jgi:hypothetical protein
VTGRKKHQLNRQQLWLLTVEIGAIKKAFPQFHLTQMRGEFVWTGNVQPSQHGDVYRLEIRYDGFNDPRVYVREPRLELAPGKSNLPHVFVDSGSLCLYYPPDGDWKPGDLLAKTIIPWAILWLYYYEIWMVTGEWRGGGVPHPPATEKEQTRVEQPQENPPYPSH